MKRAKHSKPYRAAQIALALVVALAAAAAAHAAQPQAAQSQAGTSQSGQTQSGQPQSSQSPPQLTPVPAATGPRYGPELHPQAPRSEPGAQPEQTPQAQEEKAGGMPQQPRHQEVDPSARPAPQQTDPARSKGKQDPNKQARTAPRRSVQANVARVPEVQPAPGLPMAAPPPAQPVPLRPAPAQVNCVGNTCNDAAGTTYQTGVGNAALTSQGRLCTQHGSTMQCF